MRISKKILAIALSILMAVSMMPFTVFAATTRTVNSVSELESAVAAATAGDTIQLGSDIDFRNDYTWGVAHYIDISGLTLDLNQHQIDVQNFGIIWTGKNLTIKNGTFVGEKRNSTSYGLHLYGKDNNGDIGDTPAEGDVAVQNAVLEDLTVVGGINVWNGTNVVIRNCDVQGQNYYAVWANTASDVTIESGTYTSDCIKANALLGASKENLPKGKMTITGGDFTVPANKQLVLTSHAYENVKISGGTYNVVVPEANWADGYVGTTEPDENGKYTVETAKVAEVNGVKYETLEAALAAAQNGDTITLLDDVVVTSPIVVPANKDVKLDVNGYSISGNIADADGKKLIQVSGKLEFVGSNGGCIYNTNVAGQGHAACQALTGGTVIVNAPVTFGDSDTNRTNANAVNRGCGIQNNGGTLIINNGYFTAIDANYSTGAWAYAILNCAGDTTIYNATVYGNNLHGALGCEEGTLTVNDGSFTVSGANNYYSLYCDGGSITVNGGTFNDNSKYGVNYVGENSSTTITGGDFTYSATTPFVQSSSTSNPVVSGGTYSAVVPADCCAPGFVPVTEPNAQGKYEVAKDTSDTVSITTADEIDVNLYFGETGEEATVEYTFNTTPDIQQDTQGTKVVDFDSLPEVAGKRKLTIRVAPAQIRDNIDIVIKDAQGGVLRSYENYSVAEYCDQLVAGDYSANIKTLAKSVLDYGKAAANFFGYNEYAFTNQADNFNSFTFDPTGWTAVADGIDIEKVRYVATSVPSLRFEVEMTEAEAERYTVETDKGYAAKFVKVEDKVILQVTGIPASKLGETITVTVKDAQKDVVATIQYTPIIFAYNASKEDNEDLARLGNTIGQYSAAAKAVFA